LLRAENPVSGVQTVCQVGKLEGVTHSAEPRGIGGDVGGCKAPKKSWYKGNGPLGLKINRRKEGRIQPFRKEHRMKGGGNFLALGGGSRSLGCTEVERKLSAAANQKTILF